MGVRVHSSEVKKVIGKIRRTSAATWANDLMKRLFC